MDAFIELKNVVKSYTMGDVTIYANNGVNFKVNKGEFTVIVGASGAGKTTILNMLGGMDTPTSGTILVDGHNIATYDDKQLTDYRRDDIGFVFQFYNLVQNLTALENVELASQISKDPLNSLDILERVGLGGRKDNFPAQLSGGEQQRVALARAMIKPSYRAVNSSVWQLLVLSLRILNYYSVMNQQVHWIIRQVNQFLAC